MEQLRNRVKPSRPTRFLRFKQLKCFPEAHKRIVSGWPIPEVVTFIQQESKEYDDVNREHLINMLHAYRQSLTPAQLVEIRIPEAIIEAKKQIAAGMDELEELQKLAELQKARIEIDVSNEKKIKKLFKSTGAEVYILMRILKNRAELKLEMGIDQRAPVQMSLDVTLTKDLEKKFGRPEIAQVMRDPGSRHRLLALAERLRKVDEKAAKEVTVDVTQPSDPVVVDDDPGVADVDAIDAESERDDDEEDDG